MEFLWQEGHTCHRFHQEAKEEVERALRMYETFYREFLALPGFAGKKSETERFPGALDTFTYEMLMPDGKALQGCTSHDLGQNFSKPFEISFQDKDGKKKYVWQTCWGFSTRSIGALIMVHGDDQGLILPPKIAPIQVVIIPIFEEKTIKEILAFCSRIKEDLEKTGIRVELDSRTQYTPGWKFNEWELKGVPLRIEAGTQEIKGNYFKIVRRDTGEDSRFKIQDLSFEVQRLLDKIQGNLYKKAEEFLEENTYRVKDYQELKEIMKTKKGFIWAFWCESQKCEAKIKEETKATTRLLPFDAKKQKGKCIYCGKKAEHLWLFARTY
jgi:prolyl-tRNA synthetase